MPVQAPADVAAMKAAHPAAEVLVHPECPGEVHELADQVLSTSGICRAAKASSAPELIIATEIGILHRVEKENPDKRVYASCQWCDCSHMRVNTLEKILWSLEDLRHVVRVPEEVRLRAKRALDRLHGELMDINPSAARSLEEGMEETLTVHRLRVPDQLRRTLSSTNVIESAFSIVETVCRNVKRWRAGDQIERWVGSGLLVAERQFRKVIGFRQIPLLLSSLANGVAKKPIAKGAAVA